MITYLTAAATAAGDQRAACVKGVAPTVAWAIVVAQDSRSCETKKFKKNNTHMATNMHTIMATAEETTHIQVTEQSNQRDNGNIHGNNTHIKVTGQSHHGDNGDSNSNNNTCSSHRLKTPVRRIK